jgi:hypothetical protein
MIIVNAIHEAIKYDRLYYQLSPAATLRVNTYRLDPILTKPDRILLIMTNPSLLVFNDGCLFIIVTAF